MRAASATGALYPIELYIVSGKLPDLDAGVYHFDPLDFDFALKGRGFSRAGSPAKSIAALAAEAPPN